MGERRRRAALSDEQREERFDTGGVDFLTALKRVIAGGREQHEARSVEDERREAD